jgi:hypothetical protein
MAFGRTLSAAASATLAVVELMELAFRHAGFTDFGAQPARFGGEVRLASHEVHRRPAKLGAIVIQANAFGELGGVGLAPTGFSTKVTFARTPQTRFDTCLELIVHHNRTLLQSAPLFSVCVLEHHHHGDPSALLGALVTGVGTLLATVAVLPLAFRGAQLADLGRRATDLARKARSTRHELDGGADDAGTIGRQPNAFAQPSIMRLEPAVFGTVLAFASTADTRVDAWVEVGINHVPDLHGPCETDCPRHAYASKCRADIGMGSRLKPMAASDRLPKVHRGLSFDGIPCPLASWVPGLSGGRPTVRKCHAAIRSALSQYSFSPSVLRRHSTLATHRKPKQA